MPVDRGAIDAQLREIGEGDRWWEQREFRDLPHILQADEQIRGLALGKLLGARRPRLRPAGYWLVIVTTHRLICLKQERFARKQIEILAGEVRRVQRGSRMRSYQIAIETSRWKYRIRIAKADAFRFAAAVDTLLPAAPPLRLEDDASPSWLASLPGVSGLLQKGSSSSAEVSGMREQLERVESTVERMQREMERLQNQVAFLEDLLQQKGERGALHP